MITFKFIIKNKFLMTLHTKIPSEHPDSRIFLHIYVAIDLAKIKIKMVSQHDQWK